MSSSRLLSTLLPCCFSSNPYASADAYLQPLTMRAGGAASDGGRGGPRRAPPSLEEVLDASAAAREALWRRLGTLEPLALSHLVGAVAGGPKVSEKGRGGLAFDARLVLLFCLVSAWAPFWRGERARLCVLMTEESAPAAAREGRGGWVGGRQAHARAQR